MFYLDFCQISEDSYFHPGRRNSVDIRWLNSVCIFCSRRISCTFCRMTCSQIWLTSPICSCMETASVPSLRMCFEAWSTWTASLSMTTVSGRSTVKLSVTSVVWPSYTCSTIPCLSCQVRQWKTPTVSSSSASTVIPGPVAVKRVLCGNGSERPVSPPLSSRASPHPNGVARTWGSSGSWTLLSAHFQTLVLWLGAPQPPSAQKPAGGSPRTNPHLHPSHPTKRLLRRRSPFSFPRSSPSSPSKSPLKPSPNMNFQSTRLRSPKWIRRSTGPTTAMKTLPSAASSQNVL